MTNEQGLYLIYGGTGSLGRAILERLTREGKEAVVYSRDEAKHHALRLECPGVRSIIGDIRDYASVLAALNEVRPAFVINAAAMKQIPLSEEFPYEAVLTNTMGAHHVVQAVREHCRGWHYTPLKVLSISTDKVVKPVNSYGMTKALQERIHLRGNNPPHAVHTCVRYGNVLDSTGSMIPVFKARIARGEPLRLTDPNMTRFLLSLPQAVDLIFRALEDTEGGKIFVPKLRAARIADVAEVLIAASGKPIGIEVAGIRPGEKLHELLISEEEVPRTEEQGDVLVVRDINGAHRPGVAQEYSSKDNIMSQAEVRVFFETHGII